MNSNKFTVINLKPNKTNNKNSTVREKNGLLSYHTKIDLNDE